MSVSSSSSLLAPSQWRYDVFPSFNGQDVRRNFLSHLLCEFNRKGINTFVDDQIRRSESIGPELARAIRASRIGIVILTKNYASSSWCLDELLEIMECRKTADQKVMPIFYDMDPSDVRKQTGDFGMAFERTCEGKTEEQKQSWRKALTDVANIGGEHSHNWLVLSTSVSSSMWINSNLHLFVHRMMPLIFVCANCSYIRKDTVVLTLQFKAFLIFECRYCQFISLYVYQILVPSLINECYFSCQG